MEYVCYNTNWCLSAVPAAAGTRCHAEAVAVQKEQDKMSAVVGEVEEEDKLKKLAEAASKETLDGIKQKHAGDEDGDEDESDGDGASDEGGDGNGPAGSKEKEGLKVPKAVKDKARKPVIRAFKKRVSPLH